MRAIGQDRIQHADDLYLNDLRQRKIEDSCILPFIRIKSDVAASGNYAGIDREAEPVGRFEFDGEIRGPRLPPWSGNVISPLTPTRSTAKLELVQASIPARRKFQWECRCCSAPATR